MTSSTTTTPTGCWFSSGAVERFVCMIRTSIKSINSVKNNL